MFPPHWQRLIYQNNGLKQYTLKDHRSPRQFLDMSRHKLQRKQSNIDKGYRTVKKEYMPKARRCQVNLTMKATSFLTKKYISNLRIRTSFPRTCMINNTLLGQTPATSPHRYLISHCRVKNNAVIIHLQMKQRAT